MKFCDKLQKIRKENNITQEGLADKLGVSRQAVSKWESGTAYPDTEKLIQMSKIFNISLDELVNDNKDNNIKKDKKFNIIDTINIIVKFIIRSFSMFWSMKFSEKVKCLLEIGFLILGIIIIAHISDLIIMEIIRKIFMFLPNNILYILCQIVESLLYIAWIILGSIVVIRIFKTRYLDYYVIIDDDNVKERVVEEPIKELKEKKEYKVVIRDPEHSSFNFMKKIGKIVLFMFKCFCIFISLPIILGFIFMVIALVISLSYVFNGLFFIGISLSIFGGLLFVYLILEFMYNTIFNRSNAYNRVFIMFIVSISLIGIGIGISFSSLNKFKIIDNREEIREELLVDWNDKLVIQEVMDLSDNNIIIDNSINNIKLDIVTNIDNNVNTYSNDMGDYKVIHFNYNYSSIDIFKEIIKDLKNKKINKYYDNYYRIDKIYISQDNLTKLKENNKNYYQ